MRRDKAVERDETADGGAAVRTIRIKVYGIVQGVGFRPTVDRHASRAGISGSVCNKGPYVEIYARGSKGQIDTFLGDLEEMPPKRAVILKMDVKDISEDDFPGEYGSGFSIITSEKTKGEIFISPDIAICEECKEELFSPSNRRYLHPFINCTCCGPRLTILDALPYDRERTSMKMFPMCAPCEEEYTNPASRRYDAQPVCCNDCGPQVYALSPATGEELSRGREAITKARAALADGKIVAVKGIGGFHLACDAANEEAVNLLRARKTRPAKPFAVMMRDLEAVKRECILEPGQEEILTGHQKPILLLKRRENGRLAESVAPGNPKIGVMLPYAPVQLLLFQYEDSCEVSDMLVMTSGNISGAPICRDDREAVAELGHLCDLILSHDRKIRIRADDSVMDFWNGAPYMIRRSRGYAPLPYLLSEQQEEKTSFDSVLAMGGELKNTFCIGNGNLYYPSSYIGDLADLRSVKALEETVDRYTSLLEIQPQVVACDLHPRYNSTEAAMEYAGKRNLPLVQVQHHFAHIVSCLAENDHPKKVIGVSFDGTGYGTDGTVWGGEILLADYRGFTRFGAVESFIQVGGDLSSKEGWRIAASMLGELYADCEEQWTDVIQTTGLCTMQEANVIRKMAEKRVNAVESTSAGRLFDAVSAILGIRRQSTFEGEASMALEFAAENYMELRGKEKVMSEVIRKTPGELIRRAGEEEMMEYRLSTLELVRELTQARMEREDAESLAFLFHYRLAEMIAAVCDEARADTGFAEVALSGGCFQNRLLTGLSKELLEERGFTVLTHSLVPPNDGGIALGQAVAAIYRKKEE